MNINMGHLIWFLYIFKVNKICDRTQTVKYNLSNIYQPRMLNVDPYNFDTDPDFRSASAKKTDTDSDPTNQLPQIFDNRGYNLYSYCEVNTDFEQQTISFSI